MKKKDQEVNYFASMTDMVVGILFIFIIMIAYFAFQVSNVNKDQNPLSIYIDRGEEFRKGIADKVAEDLRKHNIDAQVSPKNPGVVTLRGSGLFESGDSSLDKKIDSRVKIDHLSDVIAEKINCFVYKGASSVFGNKCNNKDAIYLEAIFIEGHTDNIVLNGVLPDGSKNNLELSAKRATNTYSVILQKNPVFSNYKNPDGEQILSVAAYGEQRPVESNFLPSGREANRRIDIRFVMWVPKNQADLDRFLKEAPKN